MASILLVTPRAGAAADVVAPLALLTHQIRVAPASLQAVDLLAREPDPDVVLLDARDDLVTARRLSVLLAGHPVLLLVRPDALALLRAEWGLADFVVDPTTPAELEARIRLLAGPAATRPDDGPVQVDEDAYQATLDGRPLDLTYTEFELLKYLVANPGRVHTREVLLHEVWGYDYFGGTRTVDVHVRRLRAKFGNEHESLIETVRNVGYRYRAR